MSRTQGPDITPTGTLLVVLIYTYIHSICPDLHTNYSRTACPLPRTSQGLIALQTQNPFATNSPSLQTKLPNTTDTTQNYSAHSHYNQVLHANPRSQQLLAPRITSNQTHNPRSISYIPNPAQISHIPILIPLSTSTHQASIPSHCIFPTQLIPQSTHDVHQVLPFQTSSNPFSHPADQETLPDSGELGPHSLGYNTTSNSFLPASTSFQSHKNNP